MKKNRIKYWKRENVNRTREEIRIEIIIRRRKRRKKE